MASESIHVEVCYARPDVQAVVALTVAAGTTALDAVRQSGLAHRFPELSDASHPLGISGKRVDAAQVLEEGDRVEILRPLTADPKEARRRRAAGKKSK
ncbi:MAG TPA: RnfH family protein [Gammaproteobacteria bacterium]|nr:RnfH family protein [Gammaproteobacteria bacterium]